MTERLPGLPGNAEEMDAFFDARAEGYEDHMHASVPDLAALHASLADVLPASWTGPRVLDLGIGTGLELDALFERFPNARVTGIDLSQGMLQQLARKRRRWDGHVRTVHGSFLELHLGHDAYDAVISAMALHHWGPDVKRKLYDRIRRSLVPGGLFVNADYVASGDLSPAQDSGVDSERHGASHHLHIDLPLPVSMERQLLRDAGFSGSHVVFLRPRCATIVAATARRLIGCESG